MKKTIILSLCALVALACAKETAPVSAEFGQAITVPAEIEATIDATKLGLDNSLNLSWQEGDQIYLRMSNATWTEANNCNTFTAVQEDGKLTFKGELQYVAGKNGFMYSCAPKKGLFPDPSSSSCYLYTWASTQSGLVENIGLYSVLWAKTDGTKPYGIVKDGDIYKISANFVPFGCFLKFNIKEGLGVAKVVVKANQPLGGDITMYCSRAIAWGSGKFAFYNGSYAKVNPFNEITINRDGDEIFGDVLVCICPNDVADGDFINSATELTFEFYDEDDEKLGELTKSLTTPLKNAQIKNLGNVTGFNFKKEEPPVDPLPTEFEPKLKIVASDPTVATFIPQYVVDVHPGFIEAGAKFFYSTSTTGIDDVATPTTSSPEIPETGIPADPDSAYEVHYVKVLATCPGYNDYYIKAAIRNWRFGDGKTCESNDDITLPPYDRTYGSAPKTAYQTKATTATSMSVHTIMGGEVSQFLKLNNGSKALNFEFWVGDQKTGSIAVAANTYMNANPGYFISDTAVTAAAGTVCEVKMSAANSYPFYLWNYAVMEQDTFTPASAPQASATINGLTNASQYNF